MIVRYWIVFAAALCLHAQDNVLTLPRVGVIDFYGLHTVRPSLVTQALGVRPGSPMPDSRLNAEERINDIDDVLGSHLEAICCNAAGEVILYVGIEEYDAPHYEIRPPPGGSQTLPAGLQAVSERDAPARLAALANENKATIRQVLRESSSDRDRAMAALLISHATPAYEVTEELEYALRDAHPEVRAIAARRLTALAEAARRDPATRIRVQPAWFVQMLHSLYWSDRMEASKALATLTAPGDPATLSQLRANAFDALIEMARWKTPEHARPAFTLVGRMAGLPEAEIETAFLRDERERVIAAAGARK